MSFAKRSLGLLTLSASALLVSETRNATRARVPDHSSAPDAGETTKAKIAWALSAGPPEVAKRRVSLTRTQVRCSLP
jgi:hypothetical protein